MYIPVISRAPTRIPPCPILLLDYPDKLGYQLVPAFTISISRETSKERSHLFGTPSLASKEEFGEPFGRLERQGGEGEIAD